MTEERRKGMAPSSIVLEKAIQARALGLESLSCIIPKISQYKADDVATKTSGSVFPLKESYRKNIQHPHSQTYWDTSAKDYRHELLMEIADEEEMHKRDDVQARPKIRRIPDMPSLDHLHHDSQMEELEAENINAYRDRQEEKNFHKARDYVDKKVRKTYQLDDEHYNAILNVQDDEDLFRNSKKLQAHGQLDTIGIQSQLRTDNLFQEYLRLMAICEKHEERENSIRRARMSRVSDESQAKDYTFRQPVSFDRPQQAFVDNESMDKDTVSDSRQSYDQFSVSNLSSPTVIDGSASSMRSSRGRPDLSETFPTSTEEPLRRSLSFDRRCEAFRENKFMNRVTGLETQNHPTFPAQSWLATRQRNIDSEPGTTSKRVDSSTQSQLDREKAFHIRQNQVLVNKKVGVTGPVALSELFPSSNFPGKGKSSDRASNALSTVGTETSTIESFRMSESIECPSKPMKQNKFRSKITVIDSQHSPEPIFVSTSTAPPMSKNEGKETSSPYKSSKGKHGILDKVQFSQEDEPRSSIFDTMTNETILDSNNSSDPTFLSDSSSSTPIYQKKGAARSTASVAPSRNRADLPTPQESLRRPPKRQNNISRIVSGSKERSVSDMLPDNPDLSAMAFPKSLKDSTSMEERSGICQPSSHGSNRIECNSQTLKSELSYTWGASIRPITPSPTASNDCKQHFGISPERDVECDRGKQRPFYEANPYIPAYSDSVIIGRPVFPENSNQYDNQEYGSIAGLSPVTCSGSQFQNRIFPNLKVLGKDECSDESVDREPIERRNATIKVQHLSTETELDQRLPHPSTLSQTCMPLLNRKIRSVVDGYNTLKKSSKLTLQPDNRRS